MFLNQILQEWILLVIGERHTAQVNMLGDIGDQSPAPQFNIVRMRTEKKEPFSEKNHDQSSRLFLGDDSADDLRHDELTRFIKFDSGGFFNLAHDVFEIVRTLEEARP